MKRLLAAVFSCLGFFLYAEEAIYINFASGNGNTYEAEGWNNLTGASGTSVSVTSADGEKTASVTWSSKNSWEYAGVTDDILKGYLDDGSGVSITVANVPYAEYDVTVYFATDNSNKKFRPAVVNGVSYTWDGSATAAGTAEWGSSHNATAVEGTNELCVNAQCGSTLTITTSTKTGTARGSITAVKLVKRGDAAFSYVPGRGAAPAGWFTAWGGESTYNWEAYCPMKADTYVPVINSNYHPYYSYTWGTAGSVAIMADVSNTELAANTCGVIAAIGRNKNNGAYVLARYNRGVRLVRCTSPKNKTYLNGTVCEIAEVSAGYHLFFITYSTTDGISLAVDDGEAVANSSDDARVQLPEGIQLGSVFGGIGNLTRATGVAVAGVWGWDEVVSSESRAALYAELKPYLGTPVPLTYTCNYSGTNPFTIMTASGDYALQGTKGTFEIPAGNTVTVPSVCFGNSATSVDYTFNLKGTLNVTSESTTYNVYSEKSDKKGILLGHWAGNGVDNITGTLNAPNAYLQTIYSGYTSVALNIDGGTVNVRGLYANSSKSTISLSNGGTLAFADFNANASAIPLTCAEGTLRATSSGDFTTGWTYPSAVTFTDTAVGTTVDPNGMAIAFSGSVSGAGTVTCADSSAEAAGSVAFTSLGAYTGTIVASNVTLRLGGTRPNAAMTFGPNVKLVVTESLADANNKLGLSFTGETPSVEITNAAGESVPAEDISVGDNADGTKYFSFPTAATPIVSGSACWYDFEFEGYSAASVGYNTATLSRETTKGIGAGQDATYDFASEHALYTASLMYTPITYPVAWSAAIYATLPKLEDGVLMSFGTAYGLIALVGGASDNEAKLVRATNNTAYETLATMSVPNATTCPHLYVFSKSDKGVDIYLDGALWTTYATTESIEIKDGFQLGAVYGTKGNTGVKDFNTSTVTSDDDVRASQVGMLRLYESTLSQAAIDVLAQEFPYGSPNGTFTRTVSSATADWSSEGAWTMTASDGTTSAADAPVDGSVVILTATADCTITLNEAVARHLESLTIGGTGKVTFVAAEGASLVNDGRTTIQTEVTLPLAVNVTGGPLALGDAAKLVFDYSNYTIDYWTPNGTNTVTGLTSEGDVTIIAPTAPRGRTYTVAYNATTQRYEIQYGRGPLTLRWRGAAETWGTETLWTDAATGDDAAFLNGDSVVFAPVEGVVTLAVTTDGAKTIGSILVTNETATAFALTLSGLSGTVGDVTVAAGTDAETRLGLKLEANGALALNGLVEAGANDDLVLGGTGAITLAGSLAVDATATLKETGSGSVTYASPADDYQINGTLEVSGGTFTYERALRNVIATETNPIKVNGTGRLKAVGSAVNDGNRLPDGAYVVIEDGGVFEAEGNNPFPRESETKSPRIICRNGGTFQVNGVSTSYDVHVWSVTLESGILYLAKTAANWGSQGVVLDCGTLTSTGTSSVKRQSGCPNRLVVSTVDVQDGTLDLGCWTSTDLVKTGAGALSFSGNGRTATGVLAVSEGALVANAALTTNFASDPTGAITFATGATLDLSGLTEAYNVDALGLAGTVTVTTGDRTLASGDQLLSWTTEPAATFKIAGVSGAGIVKKSDGIYIYRGFVISIR